MRRVFAVVLAMLLVFGLTACGEDQPTNAPTQPQVTQPQATQPQATEPTPTEPAPTEPPHTHAYTEKTVAPTCTEAGYTVHTCDCGDSYTDSEAAATGHNYVDATCTAPKTCSACGVTEGEAKGHDYAEGNCTTPKTCKVCGEKSGEAAGHSWIEATCTAPKTCTVCGTQEGELGSHQDVKGYCAICGKQVSCYADLEENTWEVIMVYSGNVYKHHLTFSKEFPSSAYTKEYTPNESDWDSTFGIEYEGVKYDSGYGESDNVEYIIEGDRIICNIGYDDFFYGVVVLERVSGTALKVVSVEIADSEEWSPLIFTGVEVGTVFITQGGHTFSNTFCTEGQVCAVCGTVGRAALGHEYVSGVCTVCGARG